MREKEWVSGRTRSFARSKAQIHKNHTRGIIIVVGVYGLEDSLDIFVLTAWQLLLLLLLFASMLPNVIHMRHILFSACVKEKRIVKVVTTSEKEKDKK